MIWKILENLAFMGVLLFILGLEQVYGLPILFLCLVVLFSARQKFGQRLLVWSVAGLSLATMYHFPLSWGITLLFVLPGIFLFTQRVMKSITARALFLSLIGSLLVALWGQVEWQWATALSITISLILSLVITRNLLVARGSESLRFRHTS